MILISTAPYVPKTSKSETRPVMCLHVLAKRLGVSKDAMRKLILSASVLKRREGFEAGLVGVLVCSLAGSDSDTIRCSGRYLLRRVLPLLLQAQALKRYVLEMCTCTIHVQASFLSARVLRFILGLPTYEPTLKDREHLQKQALKAT